MTTASHFPPLAAILLAGSSVGALAQSAPVQANKTADDWTVSAGAALASAPSYSGAAKTKTMAIPTFDIRYRDWFFINPFLGVGVSTELLDGLRGSASLGPSFDRREAKDEARLNGLGDVRIALAVNLSLDYKLGNAFTKTRLVSRLGSGNERGTVLEAEAGYNVLASRSGVLGLGLQVKAVDGTYASNFSGVSASQSAASGLAVFNAKAGVASVGAFVQAIVPVNDRWTFFGRAAYNQLRNDAANSPITVDRDQATLLATMIYKF